MADEQETTTENESSESPNVRQMRERLEALEQRNSDLEGRVRLSAFKEAGLDPETGGLNKAVYRTYDGDPDPDKIREFASAEYDWEAPTPGPSDAQQRMSQAFSAGNAPDPKSPLEKANDAAQEGDWVTSGALKDQQLLAISERKYGYQ